MNFGKKSQLIFTLGAIVVLAILVKQYRIDKRNNRVIPAYERTDIGAFTLITIGSAIFIIGSSFYIASFFILAYILWTIGASVFFVGVVAKLVDDQFLLSDLHKDYTTLKGFVASVTQDPVVGMERFYRQYRILFYNLAGTLFYTIAVLFFLLGSAIFIRNTRDFVVLGDIFWIIGSVLVIVGSGFKIRQSLLASPRGSVENPAQGT